jgi:hypothetical protein
MEFSDSQLPTGITQKTKKKNSDAPISPIEVQIWLALVVARKLVYL